LETRKWQDKEGKDRYTTEVVLRPYRSELTMLDSRGGGDSMGGGYGQQISGGGAGGMADAPAQGGGNFDLDDEIPF